MLTSGVWRYTRLLPLVISCKVCNVFRDACDCGLFSAQCVFFEQKIDVWSYPHVDLGFFFCGVVKKSKINALSKTVGFLSTVSSRRKTCTRFTHLIAKRLYL